MSAIRVIQFTDPHLFGDVAGTLRGVNTHETLERILADAAGHLAMCDAILVTGDLVQDDATGYEHFKRLFARAEEANHTANHEWRFSLPIGALLPVAEM